METMNKLTPLKQGLDYGIEEDTNQTGVIRGLSSRPKGDRNKM